MELLNSWHQIKANLCCAFDTAISFVLWEVLEYFQSVPYRRSMICLSEAGERCTSSIIFFDVVFAQIRNLRKLWQSILLPIIKHLNKSILPCFRRIHNPMNPKFIWCNFWIAYDFNDYYLANIYLWNIIIADLFLWKIRYDPWNIFIIVKFHYFAFKHTTFTTPC